MLKYAGCAILALCMQMTNIAVGAAGPLGVDLGPGTLTPFVNYQVSMDDSVNTENELWSGMSLTFSF